MKVSGKSYRSIWPVETRAVAIIDQSKLPHEFVVSYLRNVEEAATAIRTMQIRGAPLIGATAAYGIALAMNAQADRGSLDRASALLLDARPTAVNLSWAVERVRSLLLGTVAASWREAAWFEAMAICDEDVALNSAIGAHGLDLLRTQAWRNQQVLQIMTHCNAGWLATVDGGTALAPVYAAFDAGVPLHVWVSETRPRNQGTALTCWELAQHGVPHTLIADNAAGLHMRRGEVDAVIVGADRVTAAGDVCNKVGTYLKALAARDCAVPFYVAVPGPTIDWRINDADLIEIEQRSANEITRVSGLTERGTHETVRVAPPQTRASNYAFDITPARLVSAFITERGVCAPSSAGLRGLYPDRKS